MATFKIDCSVKKLNNLMLYLTKNEYSFDVKHYSFINSDNDTMCDKKNRLRIFNSIKKYLEKIVSVDFDSRTLGDRFISESVLFYIAVHRLKMPRKELSLMGKISLASTTRRILYAQTSIKTNYLSRNHKQVRLVSIYMTVMKKIFKENLNKKLQTIP